MFLMFCAVCILMIREMIFMRLKKIAFGIIPVLALSCTVLYAIPANGAESTVKISASNETVSAGEQFAVSISLSDIPETGIQGAEFAVTYDNSIVSVEKVEIGELAKTGADDADGIAQIPSFGSVIFKQKNAVVLSYSVAENNPKYYMHGEGVMCTIKGTVLENASAGSVAEFKIVPNPRKTNNSGTAVNNNKIWLGYDSDPDEDITNYIFYDSEVSHGSVTVSGSDITDDGVKGDATGDGIVDIADVVATASYVGDPIANTLSDKALILCDVHNSGDGVTGSDVLMIQQYVAKIIKEF